MPLLPNGHENGTVANFLTLPREQLLVVKRKHWFVLTYPILLILLCGLLLIAGVSYLFTALYPSPTLLISSVLTLFLIMSSATAKTIVEWYFHLYVITSEKILEISHSPLSSHVINDVLLDQVRCTEVDIKRGGLLNELIDMGDVIITFDRPTHQEEFVLCNIKDSQKIGIFLADVLHDTMRKNIGDEIWYRSKEKPHPFSFTDEIFPGAVPLGIN